MLANIYKFIVQKLFIYFHSIEPLYFELTLHIWYIVISWRKKVFEWDFICSLTNVSINIILAFQFVFYRKLLPEI